LSFWKSDPPPPPKANYTATATCPKCKTEYTGYSNKGQRYANQGAAAKVSDCERNHKISGSIKKGKGTADKGAFTATKKCRKCDREYTGYSDKSEVAAKGIAGRLANQCEHSHSGHGQPPNLPSGEAPPVYTATARCRKCTTEYTATAPTRAQAKSWALSEAMDCSCKR
jgi:hypothetical protein